MEFHPARGAASLSVAFRLCELKHQPVLIERFLCASHFPSPLPFHSHAPREEDAPILRKEDTEA